MTAIIASPPAAGTLPLPAPGSSVDPRCNGPPTPFLLEVLALGQPLPDDPTGQHALAGGTDVPVDGNVLPQGPAWLPPTLVAPPPAPPPPAPAVATPAAGPALPAAAPVAAWPAANPPAAVEPALPPVIGPGPTAAAPVTAVAAVPGPAADSVRPASPPAVDPAEPPVPALQAGLGRAARVAGGAQPAQGNEQPADLGQPVGNNQPPGSPGPRRPLAAVRDAQPAGAAGQPLQRAATVPVGQVTAAEPVAAHAAGLEPTRQPAERSAEVLPAQPAAPGMPSLSPPRDVAAPAVASLSAPVGSERFGQEVGERVAWMLDRDLGSAQLKLNPPQLGPLEVRVQVSGDQANVSFSAHNYLTRDALEQATPRLREMLGAQGFAQVNVSVSQHSFSERPPRPAPYEQPAGRAAAPLADIAAAAVPQPRAAAGLLDAYA